MIHLKVQESSITNPGHPKNEPLCLDALPDHEHEVPVLLLRAARHLLVRGSNSDHEAGTACQGI